MNNNWFLFMALAFFKSRIFYTVNINSIQTSVLSNPITCVTIQQVIGKYHTTEDDSQICILCVFSYLLAF